MPDSKQHHKDFWETIRNTLLVGGGAVINMTIGLVRTKFLAGTLGPAGIALTSLFTQIFEVGGAATGFGLGASGVRAIAGARASGDAHQVARVVKTLRRTVWCTGLGALLLLTSLSGVIAEIAFGNRRYQFAVALLGFVVFIRAIMTGQSCLLQGTRRISDSVLVGIAGALAALLVTIPAVHYLGEQGIAISLLGTALVTLAVSWWFAQRVPILDVEHSWSCTIKEARALATFGLPMMLTSLIGTLGPFGERAILMRTIGIEQLGIYQAAYALTGIALSFILNAMTADFYPKLAGHIGDDGRMNRETNAQIQASLLLLAPALAWLVALAPWFVTVLYNKEFQPAAIVLEVTVFGAVGRVVSWPLRLVWLAQGKSGRVFLFEVLVVVIGFFLTTVLSVRYGPLGAGVAYGMLHILAGTILVVCSRKLIGVSVSTHNLTRLGLVLMFLVVLWLNAHANPVAWFRIAIAAGLAGFITLRSLQSLAHRSGLGAGRLWRK